MPDEAAQPQQQRDQAAALDQPQTRAPPPGLALRLVTERPLKPVGRLAKPPDDRARVVVVDVIVGCIL